ncbi:MAG: hypothetical protein JO271_15990 [Verrucomicrobia bacterium]|nr:hypothetical protein [Verrucomicrobiota bacterium]
MHDHYLKMLPDFSRGITTFNIIVTLSAAARTRQIFSELLRKRFSVPEGPWIVSLERSAWETTVEEPSRRHDVIGTHERHSFNQR